VCGDVAYLPDPDEDEDDLEDDLLLRLRGIIIGNLNCREVRWSRLGKIKPWR
jgi:hypothetical protein